MYLFSTSMLPHLNCRYFRKKNNNLWFISFLSSMTTSIVLLAVILIIILMTSIASSVCVLYTYLHMLIKTKWPRSGTLRRHQYKTWARCTYIHTIIIKNIIYRSILIGVEQNVQMNIQFYTWLHCMYLGNTIILCCWFKCTRIFLPLLWLITVYLLSSILWPDG